MSQQTQVLGDLRHECRLCGGSCQGNFVRLLNSAEEARIRDAAEKLEVANPIVDGSLRMVDGRCVFLGDDQLCTIHKELGGTVKPAVCQQYPVITIVIEDGERRLGIDPGCYTSIRTWRTGPVVPDSRLYGSRVEIAPEERVWEERVLDLCSLDDVTLGRVLATLTSEAGTPFPPKFCARFIERVQGMDLPALIEDPNTAQMLRTSLRPIADAAPDWDPTSPPAWPFGADEDAYAVGVVRRMLFLRLAYKNIPSVITVAMLTAAGGLAAGWSNQDTDGFGRTLAGWVRALRAPAFLRALVPDHRTLMWLARGDTRS